MNTNMTSGYKTVNGLDLYYEIHGSGSPLVLIHGGGSTIQTNFAQVLPLFARNRQVIAMELQAHGHTADRGVPSSFEQDADDVAELLKQLNITKADIFGWSNGGQTALQIGIRHPEIIRKLVIGSAAYKRDGLYPWFWDFMKDARLENMPQPLKDAYSEINPDENALQVMHDRDAYRMQNLTDWSDDSIRNIQAPTLLIVGDRDVVTIEHALSMYRIMPNARLLVYPGIHGDFIGELCVGNGLLSTQASVELIENFLEE
jgi:pimeloyl-ACP methyl ester carboxylesterase